jgi:cobalamin biosynthesis Mg chelatase CobN
LSCKELERTKPATRVLLIPEMTSAVEIDPNSLEWTERELRRQVRELMVEVEARENAADQARKDQAALEAAQAATKSRVARRSKSARNRGSSSRKAKVGSGTRSKAGSGTRRRPSRRSSVSVRTRGARQGNSGATLWVVFGAAAVGLLGLVALAL